MHLFALGNLTFIPVIFASFCRRCFCPLSTCWVFFSHDSLRSVLMENQEYLHKRYLRKLLQKVVRGRLYSRELSELPIFP